MYLHNRSKKKKRAIRFCKWLVLEDVAANALRRCTHCCNVCQNKTTCDEVRQLPIVYPVDQRAIPNGSILSQSAAVYLLL